MTELLESIGIWMIQDTEVDCPFKEQTQQDVSDADIEDIKQDDLKGVQAAQANNGGKLGKHLEAGTPGEPATINDVPEAAPPYPEKPVDTKRHAGGELNIPRTDNKTWPYHLAAHHVIPGKAALHNSDLFKDFMRKGGKAPATIDGKDVKFTIEYNIGYDVNGSHNGVWLPGNYAIRGSTTPFDKSWGKMTKEAVASPDRNWAVAYVATSTKWKGRQFHDAHAAYNDAVREMMDKISQALMNHPQGCEACRKKKDKIPPPYGIKIRLFAISQRLRTYMIGSPNGWRAPFLTSSQFAKIKRNDTEWKLYLAIYSEADKEPTDA